MHEHKKPPVPETLLAYAKTLRASHTDAEALIWRLVRRKNFGVKFRRQHVVSGYIIDFYCHEEKLAIELDGGQHGIQQNDDDVRSQHLNVQGIKVLRFWNNDVLLNTESVLTAIWNEIHTGADSPLPSPLPKGEGA